MGEFNEYHGNQVMFREAVMFWRAGNTVRSVFAFVLGGMTQLSSLTEALGSRAAVPTTITVRQTSDLPSAVRLEGPHSGKDPEMRNLTKDGISQQAPCRAFRRKRLLASYLLYAAEIYGKLVLTWYGGLFVSCRAQPLRS